MDSDIVVVHTTTYHCPVCGKSHAQMMLAEHCRSKCLEQKRVESIHHERIHRARNEATSIHNFVELIVKYSKEWYGIEVGFKEYPNGTLKPLSSSHNSPVGCPQNWGGHGDKDEIPRTYLGWQGRWEGQAVGTVPNLGTVDYGTFRRPKEQADLGFLRVVFPGINTGTGCPGDKFSIEGKLFLHDFPKIVEEYKSRNLILDLTNPNSNVRTLAEQFKIESEQVKKYRSPKNG